ncbi:hypothetical protein FACS189427_06250 [Planctomycetales bacterium]|nr:hypothetical protein FACS189427_06250 [Planctomycetales bacterium]
MNAKRFSLFGIMLLSAVLLTGLSSGCACYPGYGYGCPSGVCTSPLTRGPVDYVDGGQNARGADCGSTCTGGNNAYYGGINSAYCGYPCLYNIGYGIRVIGEGALAVAAAPFVITGHIICATFNGYESYPNCGCSNEVYYGDNCAQAHDCAPCSSGATRGTSGCSTCNQGYSEGIRPAEPATSQIINNRPMVSQRPVKPVSFIAPKNTAPAINR